MSIKVHNDKEQNSSMGMANSAHYENEGVASAVPPKQLFASTTEEENLGEKTAQLKQAKQNADGAQTDGNATANSSNELPLAVQTKMENAMGHDFSDVNIHQDSKEATDVGALAYAQGNDVHFAPGQFNPDTTNGQELIGHELAHVVQQREGRVQPTKKQGKELAINDDESLEKEADDKGKKAVQMKSAHDTGCDCGDCQSVQLKKKDSSIVDDKKLEEEADSQGKKTAQLKSGGHDSGCDCSTCQSIQLKVDPTKAIQKREDPKAKETDESSDPYATTYENKEFTTRRIAKILSKGTDKNNVGTFDSKKEVIGKKYSFSKGTIPVNSKVKLMEEASSYDKTTKPNVKVAKVKVVSVPDGGNAAAKGQTYWTTRSNVSASAGEDGLHTVTDKEATIRSEPEDILGEKSIPSGTKISVKDVHYINDFPDDFKLKNNAERNSFHKNRYMRLYLNVSYLKDGKTISGWISASDVKGGFANEVLGTSNAGDSVESNDPTHKTIGTKTAGLLNKGGKTYESRKPAEIIAKGTFVRIEEQSSDKKFVKVTSKDGGVNGQWTSVGNLDKSKKKEVDGLDIVFYEVKDPDARIRDVKQGYKASGQSVSLGDYVKVHSSENNYLEVSKVDRVGEERVEGTKKYWIDSAHLADGWSTDLHGKNASWGVETIGGNRLTKYKGQDDLVNLGGSGGKMKQVSKAAFPNLMKMINDAKNNLGSDGKSDAVDIIVNSCFRTYFSQKYFDDNENKPGFNSAAPPGRSDHQDSNAFDLNNLRDSKVYTWLKKNAYKYDIIQNVHKSNERHHWAYLPGKGKKGIYTTWGTKSNQSW